MGFFPAGFLHHQWMGSYLILFSLGPNTPCEKSLEEVQHTLDVWSGLSHLALAMIAEVEELYPQAGCFR